VFAFRAGRPTVLIPGPHESANSAGEPSTGVPCPICWAPAKASQGKNPIYRCAGNEAHAFYFDKDGALLEQQTSGGILNGE
jgi:hypothetical protein